MLLDPESRRLRAKQVGMLMQAYRRGYEVDGRKGRLSQEGLLQLMGQVDSRYLERYNHSTVARWESGTTRPTRDRLEVFGKALNLPAAEVEGMIWLAGLDEDAVPFSSVDDIPDRIASEPASEPPGDLGQEPSSEIFHRSQAGSVVRFILTKFVLPSVVVVGLGYLLARMGWNAGWLMTLYVILAVALVLLMGFFRLRRSHELREVYFISVFFLVSGNLLQAPAIRMDPYGFYAIEGLANTPFPYLFATLVNLLIALAAGLAFEFLYRWQYLSDRGFGHPCLRACWTAFPPLVLVYVVALLFCCLGSLVYLLFVLSIMGGTFTAILALRDKELSFGYWEKRVFLQAAIAICLVLTALGGASVLILYMQPSLLAIPDHTLLRSWEINFVALGYPPDELLERYRFGALWSSLATIVYMVIVLGGSLLIAIHQIDAKDPVAAGQASQMD